MKTLRKILTELSGNRLIFISYPTKNSLEEAYKICQYWWGKKYIPLCPRILFSYMSDDRDRAIIMVICKILLLLCPNFALYGDSEGCIEEHKFAKKHQKNIFVLFRPKEKLTPRMIKDMMENNKEVILS
jgi:hypothetical protein